MSSLTFDIPVQFLTKNQLLRIFTLKSLPLKYPFLYKKAELAEILIRLNNNESYDDIMNDFAQIKNSKTVRLSTIKPNPTEVSVDFHGEEE